MFLLMIAIISIVAFLNGEYMASGFALGLVSILYLAEHNEKSREILMKYFKELNV
ncbi:hypothetical protein [Caminibacter sp.]